MSYFFTKCVTAVTVYFLYLLWSKKQISYSMYMVTSVYTESIILLGDINAETGRTYQKLKLESPTSYLEEQNISEVELPPDLMIAWALYRHSKKNAVILTDVSTELETIPARRFMLPVY